MGGLVKVTRPAGQQSRPDRSAAPTSASPPSRDHQLDPTCCADHAAAAGQLIADVGSAVGGSGPFLTCGTRGQLELCSCSRCVDAVDHGMQAGSQPIPRAIMYTATLVLAACSPSSRHDRYNLAALDKS